MSRHHHDHSHAHGKARSSATSILADRHRLLLAAVLTGAVMMVEFVGGLTTGSLVLVSDAGHMLSDTVALTIAFIADRVSERPGNSIMTYGFDRLKVLVAYTNGLGVLLLAFWIVVEAAERFFEPVRVSAMPMLVIACIGLGVNGLVYFVLHGGDRDSPNMRGALLHVVGDLLGSVAVLVAAGLVLRTGWYAADPLLALVVGLLLVRSAVVLMRETGLILLEAAPRHIDRDGIAADLVRHFEGVADIHHMHVWTLDGRQLMATLHARLEAGADAEAIVRRIKERLRREHGIAHVTVEVETGERCPDELAPARRMA
jgi:cobalt-zinc-cadmium efflux system protein